MYETIELDRRGAAAIVRLDRPQNLNAFDEVLGAELLHAVTSIADDDAVRAVCVTGAGRAFCSGADLRAARARAGESMGDDIDAQSILTQTYQPILGGLRTMPKPVVAAINGPAVGIGCSLALSCDLIVAAESAYLLLGFVNVGLVPDGGATAMIAARAGIGRAAEMAMLGERITASKALHWGLVNAVLPDDEFDAGVSALVERLAAGPTRSYAGTKRQLNEWTYSGLDDQLALEARLQQEMVATQDFAEGVCAFLDKRDASFGGT